MRKQTTLSPAIAPLPDLNYAAPPPCQGFLRAKFLPTKISTIVPNVGFPKGTRDFKLYFAILLPITDLSFRHLPNLKRFLMMSL